jgi:hypothetical protein
MEPGTRFYCYGPACRSSEVNKPMENKLYVVCKDGSIQDPYNPKAHIGWDLSRVGECFVSFHSKGYAPPGKSVKE